MISSILSPELSDISMIKHKSIIKSFLIILLLIRHQH